MVRFLAGVGVLTRTANMQFVRSDVSVFLVLNILPLENYTDRLCSCTFTHGLDYVIRNVRDGTPKPSSVTDRMA